MVHGVLSIHIIFFSILFLWIGYKLLVFSNGPIKTFTIPNFFMLKYLIFAYIGSVLYNVVFFDLEWNYGMYNNLDYVFNVWLYSSLGIVLIPLGMLIANLLFRFNNTILNNNFFSKPFKSFEVNLSVLFSIIVILCISVFSLSIYRSIIGELPIVHIFSGTNEAVLALMRSDAGNNFSGKLHWFKFLIGASSKLMLIILFFNKRRNFLWRFLFTICLFYVLFISVMNLNKAPIIDLILLLFVSGVVQKKKINFKLIIGLSLTVFFLLITMYVFFMGQADKNLLTIFKIIFHRVFVSQIVPFYWYQDMHSTMGNLMGASFPNPGGFLPFENFPITTKVFAYAYPEKVSNGLVGSLPTVFYADWWINFGAFGAIFSMLLLGFILQFLDLILKSYVLIKKSIIPIAYYIYLMFFMSKYVGTSYVGILFDFEFVLISILALALYYISIFKFNSLK
jgi:oligosaccharide repeat unit polymerase